MENWRIFWGIWEKLNYFKGFWEQGKFNFREPRKLFSWILGDQCIFSGMKGAQTPPLWDLNIEINLRIRKVQSKS